jgi:hypothetical protein
MKNQISPTNIYRLRRGKRTIHIVSMEKTPNGQTRFKWTDTKVEESLIHRDFWRKFNTAEGLR